MTNLPTPLRSPDVQLIADSPQGMVEAQRGLIAWCIDKTAVADWERNEALGNAQRAKQAGWPGEERRWKRVAGRARLKIEFYHKVRLALEAGYYIVPPFPATVFAIRTTKTYARGGSQSGRYNNHEQREDLLPAGKGEYQNPFPQVYVHNDKHTDATGKQVVTTFTTARDLRPLEFPFGLVKPQILDAVNRAFALKAFDRLSVLPAMRLPDPIIMGEIRRPGKRPGYSDAYLPFFVAWWFDTKDL